LTESAATKEDIEELGERIRISNESAAKTIVDEVVIKLSLLKSNFRLFTALNLEKLMKTAGDMFTSLIERSEMGYDVRRPITDDIIRSVDKNAGAILYGDSGSGKSMLLMRVLFEEIDKNDYTVIFGDGVEANNVAPYNKRYYLIWLLPKMP
jgi:hypothetical protein